MEAETKNRSHLADYFARMAIFGSLGGYAAALRLGMAKYDSLVEAIGQPKAELINWHLGDAVYVFFFSAMGCFAEEFLRKKPKDEDTYRGDRGVGLICISSLSLGGEMLSCVLDALNPVLFPETTAGHLGDMAVFALPLILGAVDMYRANKKSKQEME